MWFYKIVHCDVCLALVVMPKDFFLLLYLSIFCASSFSICSIGHAQNICVCDFVLQLLYYGYHCKCKDTFQPKCN